MNDYELRIERTTSALRRGVAQHHAENGTSAPPPEAVIVQIIVEGHAIVAFPVDGDTQLHNIGFTIMPGEEASAGRHAARIVAKGEMWRRWHHRVAALDLEVEDALRQMASHTNIEILGARRNGVTGSAAEISVDYRAEIRQLDGSLRLASASWSVTRHESDTGRAEWQLRENASVIPTQRRLSRMLAKSGGRPSIVVERALATRMSQMPDRNEAYKRLFAAAHGQVGTKVPWRSITLLEAREGRVIATIPLSQTARIRSDTVTMKGQALPQTVQVALAGRRIEEVVRHPLLDGRIIRRARSTKSDTVIELERDDVEYDTLSRTLGGGN